MSFENFPLLKISFFFDSKRSVSEDALIINLDRYYLRTKEVNYNEDNEMYQVLKQNSKAKSNSCAKSF